MHYEILRNASIEHVVHSQTTNLNIWGASNAPETKTLGHDQLPKFTIIACLLL